MPAALITARRASRRVHRSFHRMIDTVLAAAASAPFQTADPRHQTIMARQDNLAAVEAWQQVPIWIAFRLLAQFVADAVLAEWLLHELAAVVVTNHFGNVVGPHHRYARI